MAWRNLWRNKRRTAINLTAVTVSTSVLIVSYALILGLSRQLVSTVTDFSLGEAQVHTKSFRKERSLYETISQPERVLNSARRLNVDAAPRALGYGLASLASRSAGMQLTGMDPPAERSLGELPRHLEAGEFLSSAANKQIVLGSRLAKMLEAKIGDEIVVVVQAGDGSTGSELFRVRGILKPVSEVIDRAGALIHRDDFGALFSMQNPVHEIALSSHGAILSKQLAAQLSPAAPELETLPWQKLLPIVADLCLLFEAMLWVIAGVFFIAGGLGVLNTMLMASYERIPEFGLVKALGATPARVVGDVVIEGLWIGLIATALGGTLGYLGGIWAERIGIDVSAFGNLNIGGMTLTTVWKGHLTTFGIVLPIATMWSVSIIAALIPALKAARLDPVEALNHV
jgi:ABC-type lipoprotein release transport system permease subunit